MFYALLCLGIIFFIAPDAAGSGAPENKGWLNGSSQEESLFTWRNTIVRAIATIFSNASGFPVGREGPNVSMGSGLAYCVTGAISRTCANVNPATSQREMLSVVDQPSQTAAMVV